MAEAKIWECEECGNKNRMNSSAGKSVRCIGCETEYALVRDPESTEPALVPYFNQRKAEKASN